MLLRDHNLPHQLRDLLAEFGLKSESTTYRSWETLRNGDLVAVANIAGFSSIFTRDTSFARSASTSLLKFSSMAIVVIPLPERSWRLY